VAAQKFANAEDELQALVEGFAAHEDDWVVGVGAFGGAVDGQIRAALHDLRHPEEMLRLSQLVESTQEAIDVLKFAMERSDDAR
jgi:hypothetical protein